MAEIGQYWRMNKLDVGIDPVVLDYLQKSSKVPLGELVNPKRPPGDWRDYAWRWALCHMLTRNPNYKPRFKALGLALMQKQPGVSFRSAYGAMARELSFEYDFFLANLDNGVRADLIAWQWNRKSRLIPPTRFSSAEVKAKAGWQATGIQVQAGERYDVAAKGEWSVDDKHSTDANGLADGRGRLVGVVMSDLTLSEPFELGKAATFAAPADGDLYLRCRDKFSQLADNGDAVKVYVRRAK